MSTYRVRMRHTEPWKALDVWLTAAFFSTSMQKPSFRLHFGQRVHVVLKCTAGFLGRLTVALVIGGGASWHAAVVLGAERNIKTSEHQTLLRVRAWIARALQRI
jgi:hypothetical protein